MRVRVNPPPPGNPDSDPLMHALTSLTTSEIQKTSNVNFTNLILK